jgi:2-polyprenyl-6-methoxyphenol hydroxylase-like FAD-dependent oxidoreductase
LGWILFQRIKQEPNVEVRLNANIRELIWRAGRVIGGRWLESDGMSEACARVVVGTDGFYSTLAKTLAPAYETYVPIQRCMYYAYYQGLDCLKEPLDEPTVEHHFVGNSLIYIFPTDGNLTLVAVSLPIDDFLSFKKEPLQRLQAHLESLPLLGTRLRKAEIASEVRGAGNIPCYQRLPYGPGWVLVGDAHQIMDPWSGMGIDHASTHADVLAGSLDCWLNEAASWEAAMNNYHTQARSWSEKQYRRTPKARPALTPPPRCAGHLPQI